MSADVETDAQFESIDEWLDERDMARVRAARDGATNVMAAGPSTDPLPVAQFKAYETARAIGTLFGDQVEGVLMMVVENLLAAGQAEIRVAEREVYQVTGKLQDVETELAVTCGILEGARGDYLTAARNLFPKDERTDSAFIDAHGPEWMQRVHRYLG